MAAQLLRKLAGRTPVGVLRIFGSLWLPFWGAGIKIEKVSPDYRYLRVSLKRRWSNINYVGTHFGGSIYAMVDPFYMLLLINVLGRDYIVWDKAATIDFKKPGRTDLTAEFKIDDRLVEEIKLHTANGEKYLFDLPVSIFDTDGVEVASVVKTLYVRKKRK